MERVLRGETKTKKKSLFSGFVSPPRPEVWAFVEGRASERARDLYAEHKRERERYTLFYPLSSFLIKDHDDKGSSPRLNFPLSFGPAHPSLYFPGGESRRQTPLEVLGHRPIALARSSAGKGGKRQSGREIERGGLKVISNGKSPAADNATQSAR